MSKVVSLCIWGDENAAFTSLAATIFVCRHGEAPTHHREAPAHITYVFFFKVVVKCWLVDGWESSRREHTGGLLLPVGYTDCTYYNQLLSRPFMLFYHPDVTTLAKYADGSQLTVGILCIDVGCTA